MEDLLAHAEEVFNLKVGRGGNDPIETQLRQAAKTRKALGLTDKEPEDVIEEQYTTELPEEAEVAYATFLELAAARSSNGWGPSAISYLDIKSWSDLYGVELSPWDIKAIRMLDQLYLSASRRGGE